MVGRSDMKGYNAAAAKMPRFFKVLMPGDFDHKLKIPLGFKKHIIHDRLGMGTIQSPLGTTWHVKLLEEEGSMYIGEGWREFVRAHELEIGYFLVFRYEGDMVFSVEIFDYSCCLKEYTPIAHEGAKEEANFEVIPSTPAQILEGKENVRVSSRGQAIVTSLKTSRRDKCSSQGQAIATSPKTSCRGKCSSRGQAIVTSLKTGSPGKCFSEEEHYFEKTIHSTERGFIVVPRDFCRMNGLRVHMKVILNDPKGRSWKVNFLACPTTYYLGKGWIDFVKGNGLKVGNKCIFKLRAKGKDTLLDVQIFKK